MSVSRYCATDFEPNYIGTLYTLRNPDNGEIFYVGKTTDTKSRFWGHLSGGSGKKGEYISNIRAQGKKPIMATIEEFKIRTKYDLWFYDYREFYWIRNYLEYGWDLTNIRVNDSLTSEWKLKELLKTAKGGGGLEPEHFYFKNDEKGFPIYDHKKMKELGYAFSKDQFASHWAYVIDTQKYENIKETTQDYCYGDVFCQENINRNYYDVCEEEIPDEIKIKRFY